MDEVLEQLKRGVRRFQTEVFPPQAEMFAKAASEPQRPHTLFITCADSRIDPVAITSAAPGDIFVTRNIGNMVPAYGDALAGVSAVIEFAVSALRVRHIVVCGHTQCGAMNALLAPESVERLPSVKAWVENADAALRAAETLHSATAQDTTKQAMLETVTEQNVLLQMQQLKTHPSVASALAAGTLTISGWVYNIGTGAIEVAEEGSRTFTPIGLPSPIGV